MSPKAAAKAVKKEAPKAAKAEKKSSPKLSAKASKALEAAAPAADVQIDQEELEEQQAEAASKSSGGNEAALAAAAAGNPTEMSASFKNFRHHPDMENFYRFIYENDLRHEALHIMDQMQMQKQTRKAVKTLRAQPH